jgi:hypothetical protein
LIEARAGDKCWEVLAHASALTRAMSGAKIVCCKSAKDRTSMAVTAEQGAQIAARYERAGIYHLEHIVLFLLHGEPSAAII